MKISYIKSKKEKARIKVRAINTILLSLLVSSILFISYKNATLSITGFFIGIFIIIIYFYFSDFLRETARVKKIEKIFPDFLQLMSSNLRAGMTIDKAILLSSREEFSPLDKEIWKTGKDITTGKEIEISLRELAGRINSEKINKTILLIISGIRAGGNLSILLDETAANMREREFVEKKAASNVLMYVIFIFLAVAIFAPALFSLSNVLVNTLNNLMKDISPGDIPKNLPISFSGISIDADFIKYFSIVFIIAIGLLASLVIGLVSKGEEKEGIKYFPIILLLSLSTFFILKIIITKIMESFI